MAANLIKTFLIRAGPDARPFYVPDIELFCRKTPEVCSSRPFNANLGFGRHKSVGGTMTVIIQRTHAAFRRLRYNPATAYYPAYPNLLNGSNRGILVRPSATRGI